MRVPFLIVALLFLCSSSRAETQDSLRIRKWLIGGSLAVHQTASRVMEYNWWWKGDYHPFRFYNDGGFNNYSLGVDKAGHFYTSYAYTKFLNELMRYGGFSDRSRKWTAYGLPTVWALSIEVGDAFTKTYGFSFEDLLANFSGIGYAWLQDEFPKLNAVSFKYSYFPSQFYRNQNFKGWTLTRDYDGHTYWVTVDMKKILSGKSKQYWPAGLNLAAGYGVVNFSEIDYYYSTGQFTNSLLQRKFLIGLDWNLGAIPARKAHKKLIRNVLDLYHFPAPGYLIKPKTEFSPLLLN